MQVMMQVKTLSDINHQEIIFQLLSFFLFVPVF